MVSTNIAPDVAAYIRDLEDAADSMEASLHAAVHDGLSRSEAETSLRHYAQVRSEMAGLLRAS